MKNVINAGLIEVMRSASEKGPLQGSEFRNSSDRVLYSTGVNYAPCNGVIEKNNAKLQPNQIEETVAFFNARELPFVWWTDNNSLTEHNFQFGGNMTGIALELKYSSKSPAFPPEVKIEIVNTEQALHAFSKVIAECFAFNSVVERQYYKVCKVAMDRKDQLHFLAYVDGIGVSTATLVVKPGSCGIWNCATLPAYRKRGIGTSVVSLASKKAKEMGHSEVMAVLMPKGLAWGVFNNLGYKEVSLLPFYVYGASAHDLEK